MGGLELNCYMNVCVLCVGQPSLLLHNLVFNLEDTLKGDQILQT